MSTWQLRVSFSTCLYIVIWFFFSLAPFLSFHFHLVCVVFFYLFFWRAAWWFLPDPPYYFYHHHHHHRLRQTLVHIILYLLMTFFWLHSILHFFSKFFSFKFPLNFCSRLFFLLFTNSHLLFVITSCKPFFIFFIAHCFNYCNSFHFPPFFFLLYNPFFHLL